MKKPRQIVHTKRTEQGLEVSCEPIIRGDLEATWVDKNGIRHIGFSTEEELRAVGNVPGEYECIAFKPNTWPVQQKGSEPFVAHQSKGTFVPPKPGKFVIDNLLRELELKSPKVPYKHAPRRKPSNRRMLEISIMDPHFGLDCYAPGADIDYNLEIARSLYLYAVHELLALGKNYGDIDEILLPIGNDFLHAEPIVMSKGIGHGTAGGTAQPEMVAWHHAYMEGEKMLREAIMLLSEIAPVTVLEIPGNHDRYSAFTLARVMNAYFHKNDNVTVECDPSPYKFKRYGVNLIGFEHGHSVATIRLAALMANERPQDWAETKYREWHLGDQHRKGSAKPSVMEEQGVSVEFLPSLTAPNEWHRLKSFNWQKRGAMAWVWDYNYGPLARLQINIDSTTGLPYKP